MLCFDSLLRFRLLLPRQLASDSFPVSVKAIILELRISQFLLAAACVIIH